MKILTFKTIILYVSTIFCFACATRKPGKILAHKLEGKTIVIIGASSGFGKGVAIELGKCKANVVIAAPRTDLLDSVAAEVRAAGGTPLVVTMDISKAEDVQRLADEAVKQFGHIDVWMNNAGVGAIGPFWDIPIEEHARLIDINLKGIIYGSHVAIKLFRAQGYGTLINTGSIDSEVPLAYQGSYSASKAGVRSLSNVLQQELRLSGYKNIKVVTIMPWAVDTPWWRHAANHSGGTPRMAAMDGPEKVINAMVRATQKGKGELPVGWKAKASYHSHHMFPHLTERMSANIAHRYQIKNAPPAPPTSGTLFNSKNAVGGIDDGVRGRMKQEKKERKAHKKDKH